MPDPNKFSIWDALIPILGGAAAAYSPRYLGQGVQAGAGLYGAMQNQKRYAQQNTIEQAFRDKQLLEEQKQTKMLEARDNALISKDLQVQQGRGDVADALATEFGPRAENMSMDLDPKTAAYVNAVRSGGLDYGDARAALTPRAAPRPVAEPRPEYPFATGTGGIYNKETGTWSVPPPAAVPPNGEITAPPKGAPTAKPLTEAQRIQALDRAYARLAKAEEGGNEKAIAREEARIAELEGESAPNSTVQVNIPGIHTAAGQGLAQDFFGKK